MKRKMVLCIVAVVLVVGVATLFTGCTKRCSVSSSDDLYDWLKNARREKKQEVLLENDFTVYTTDDFFTGYGGQEDISGLTFNGNGHTITIKGDTGDFNRGEYRTGFFQSLTDSVVKNLTIVYDFNAEFSGASFGGLAKTIDSCTIENVHVKYNRVFKFTGDEGVGLGGLVAYATESSVILNCLVEGDFVGSGERCGGLVSYMDEGSSISGSSYSGSITFTVIEGDYGYNDAKDYIGGVGGLVGLLEGSIDSSYATIKNLYADLNSKRWSTVACDAGCLVGFVDGTGEINDCYVDLDAESDFYFHKSEYGVFTRKFRGGLIAGEVDKGAKIKNVYADLTEFTASGTKLPSSATINMAFGSCNSTNVNGVFVVSDTVHRKRTKTYGQDITVDSEKNEIDIDDIDLLGVKSVLVGFTYGAGKYAFTDIKVTREENGQLATLIADKPDSVSDDTKTFTISTASLDTGNYYHVITISVGDDVITVEIQYKHRKFSSSSIVNLVSDYDGVSFDLGETVIGGSNSKNVWKKDEITGKLIFA